MNQSVRILTLMTLAILVSCSTGKQALQKGNYSKAVFQSVERLRRNPQSRKSLESLKKAYPMAMRTLQTEINQSLRSDNPFKYRDAVDRFEIINKMADAIRRCPAAYELIGEPETFPGELAAAKKKAAAESYHAAQLKLNEGTLESAREAYYLYLDADRFVPGFRDVKNRITAARALATLKVEVEPIPVPGRYKLSSDFFYNQVFNFLNQRLKKEFLDFYTPKEASKRRNMDQKIIMSFYDFTVGTTHDSDSEKEMISKDSVKVGSATIQGHKVDVYNRVKAKYILHKREISSTGLLQVKILDARTGKILRQHKFPGSYTWRSEWATYSGDKRALSPQQVKMCQGKSAVPPPQQDLFIEFTKPIFTQLTSFFRSYYKDF
ncbi:MAG: hypothetical protein J7L89_01625 [Bacteroidales bacterium]|nr:hypothetical protein [Bacteroidales bacterium]